MIYERLAPMLMVVAALGACSVAQRSEPLAEDACAAYGFRIDTPEYRECQTREAGARQLGRVRLGYSEAQSVSDSQAACLSYGLKPSSEMYDRCVQREYEARRPL